MNAGVVCWTNTYRRYPQVSAGIRNAEKKCADVLPDWAVLRKLYSFRANRGVIRPQSELQ